jgi:DNA polymerase V
MSGLDLEPQATSERARLMATIDALNTKHGKGMVRLASSGNDDRTRQWGMRQERLTPGYTTAWADMPVAKAV